MPEPSALAPLVWIVDSAYTGELNARIGVADRLGYGYETVPLPNGNAQAYARALGERYADACGKQGARPLVLLSGTGEETIGPIADLKADFGGRLLNVFLASILPDPPDSRLREYDLVASPQFSGGNIVTTVGVAHNVTARRLEEARSRQSGLFAGLKRPLVGLLVGGNTRYCLGFDVAYARGLGRRVAAVVESLKGGLVVTNSRRTPEDALAALLGELAHLDCRLFDWREASPSFYPALLADADVFIATGDSVSMCSEASFTGKPLLVDMDEGATESFHREIVGKLFEAGAARPLNGRFEPWTYAPPDPTGMVAAAIRERLSLSSPVAPMSAA
jgi:mitochondrial fission protein ELM1